MFNNKHHMLPAALLMGVLSFGTTACASGVYARPAAYPSGRSASFERRAYDQGFADGRAQGIKDARSHRRADYRAFDGYRHGDHGYRNGDRSDYRQRFQEGFAAGYDAGYQQFARRR